MLLAEAVDELGPEDVDLAVEDPPAVGHLLLLVRQLLDEVLQLLVGQRAEIDAALNEILPEAFAAVREANRGFTFLAEAYWDLEWELQRQGFDYCYDKRLYDRLRHADAGSIRAHLGQGLDDPDGLAALAPRPREAAEPARTDASLVTTTRVFGDLDLAEEVTSEAIEAALVRWPVDGVPPKPGA